jgi:MinD-like ATPase involved in chromosome partitioning or flagellar assembly
VSREGAYVAVPQNAPRRGHVITIAVSKGGTGKSSLTLNLGAFLGMRLRMLGKTVCVIDANFQQADAGKYLDCYTPNINTIANNPALLTRERILEGLVHKPEYNLSVMLGPATPDEGNPLNVDAELYGEILELLRHHFDYILIDTPVAEKFHDIFSKFALPKANYIVVPVAPNYPTLHNTDNWLRSAVVLPRHAGGPGIDPSQIGIVLNRAEDGIGCSEADVRATMARWQFLASIPETKEWKLANNRNELVAPKAYAELNQAFATVLYAATGETVLVSNIEVPEEKRGVKALLERLGRRR